VELLVGEFEEEVGWESNPIAANLLVQSGGRDAIEGGQIRIQENLLATQDHD